MPEAERHPDADPGRCLMLAPPRESARLAGLLADAGFAVTPCPDAEALRQALIAGAGAAVVAVDSLGDAEIAPLAAWIGAQPPWSDFPFILLAGAGAEADPAVLTRAERLGNVTVLERPFPPATLVSLVRVALRSRRRQTEAKSHIEALRAAEERLRLLTGELQHRIKNTLAVVQAIAAQTFRGIPERGLMDAFAGRIQTLIQANDALARNNWQPAPIARVVDDALAPHGGGRGRFDIEGPPMMLAAKQALALSLALHELATNAVKYGALSGEAGRVAIAWAVSDAEVPQLTIRWQESGGPPVAPPTRKGFGSRLVERSLAAEFNGTVALAYDEAGVVCTIEAPFRLPAD